MQHLKLYDTDTIIDRSDNHNVQTRNTYCCKRIQYITKEALQSSREQTNYSINGATISIVVL